jgi:hypothetical protein
MKVIKLDGRHALKRRGYTWAFYFANRWETDVGKMEKAVCDAEGESWWKTTRTHLGKAVAGTRPYYIGFKNEKTATMVLLKVGV